MEKNYIVTTKNLTKRYQGEPVVSRLNLRVPGGEVFGLLGPKDSGKTTALLMLMGMIAPSSGEVKVCGYSPVTEPVKVRKKVGYMEQQLHFYENMTARQNLELVAGINGIKHDEIKQTMEKVLKFTGLKDSADKKVKLYTPGMIQQLGIADTVIKKPELVLLDEPAGKLEDAETNQILEVIKQLPGQGISVILASTKLHKMQTVCNRIGIMYEGMLVSEGLTGEIGEQVTEGQFRIEVETRKAEPELAESIGDIHGVLTIEIRGDLLMITAKSDLRAEISRVITLNNHPVIKVRVSRFNLSEIYNKYFRGKE